MRIPLVMPSWVGGLSLLLASCTTAPIAPHEASSAALADDEVRIWLRSQEEQAVLDRSGFRANVPEFERYLEEVVARLVPERLPNDTPFRVRVMVDPTLNAFAFPNGVLYLHTGLLALLENEAQLAAVLAHETAHATHRHGVRGWRSTKRTSAAMATFSVGTMGLGSILGLVGGAAAISGHSQDLEREADRIGFARLVAAGYAPEEGVRVFEIMRAEILRSKIREPFFFGSHPKLTERIQNNQNLLAALPPEQRRDGERGEGAYQRQLLPILELDAAAALRAGDLDQAERNANRGLVLGASTPLRWVLAETARRRSGPESRATAQQAFTQLTLDEPSFAPAWRGLALMQFQEEQWAEAAVGFRRYLALEPEAADRAHILSLLERCESQF
jgi:beta-barrel assembly-enhancing protease